MVEESLNAYSPCIRGCMCCADTVIRHVLRWGLALNIARQKQPQLPLPILNLSNASRQLPRTTTRTYLETSPSDNSVLHQEIDAVILLPQDGPIARWRPHLAPGAVSHGAGNPGRVRAPSDEYEDCTLLSRTLIIIMLLRKLC